MSSILLSSSLSSLSSTSTSTTAIFLLRKSLSKATVISSSSTFMLSTSMFSSNSILYGRRFSGKTTTTTTKTKTTATIKSATTMMGASPIKLYTEWISTSSPINDTTTSTTIKENNNKDYTIVFLHGLLGSSRNLKTFARNVVKQQQQSCDNSSTRTRSVGGGCRGGILMDLRGHGQSYLTQKQKQDTNNNKNKSVVVDGSSDYDYYADISTFQECTQDIDYTLQEFHKTPATTEVVAVGHSFGGRIALEYAYANAVAKSTSLSTSSSKPSTLKAVWLLDTVPGQANESVDNVLAIITDIMKNKTKSKSKSEMIEILTQHPYNMDTGTAQWLAMSYDSTNHDFGFDNELVTRLKPEFANQDFMGMLRYILESNNNNNENDKNNDNDNDDTTTVVHLVRGGKNTGWSIPIISKFERLSKEFPVTFHLHVLPSAGHNVHVDDLQGLVKLFVGT